MPTIREKYFFQLLRVKRLFSPNRETQLKLPLKIPPAPKILLCLPEHEDDLQLTQDYIPELIQIFESGQFFLAVDRSFETFLVRESSIELLPFSHSDFSSTGILKKQWMAQLPKDIFMAIDFNPTETLWSGYLCFGSLAPVRISLKKPRISYFFNIILNPNQENTFQEQVDYLVRTIRKITQSKEETLVNNGTA